MSAQQAIRSEAGRAVWCELWGVQPCGAEATAWKEWLPGERRARDQGLGSVHGFASWSWPFDLSLDLTVQPGCVVYCVVAKLLPNDHSDNYK